MVDTDRDQTYLPLLDRASDLVERADDAHIDVGGSFRSPRIRRMHPIAPG